MDDFNTFKRKIETIKEYVNKYKRAPSINDEIPEIRKLAKWIKKKYHDYEYNQIPMNDGTYQFGRLYIEYWEKFLDEYSDIFKSHEQIWYEKLHKAKQFIDNYDKQNELNKKVNQWILLQSSNYHFKQKMMSNESIRSCWELFLELYSEYIERNFEIDKYGLLYLKRNR